MAEQMVPKRFPPIARSSPEPVGAGPGAGVGQLFLREEEMRLAQDLFFLAWRELTAVADPVLAEVGLGRAHHRVVHFVGRHPGIPVGTLLILLGITKQSLARVLGELVGRGLVEQTVGRRDRRQRLLTLTESGWALERQLFDQQRERILQAYRDAGAGAVDGFRRVMRGMVAPERRAMLEAEPVPRRPVAVRN